jgi:hypothetical protein
VIVDAIIFMLVGIVVFGAVIALFVYPFYMLLTEKHPTLVSNPTPPPLPHLKGKLLPPEVKDKPVPCDHGFLDIRTSWYEDIDDVAEGYLILECSSCQKTMDRLVIKSNNMNNLFWLIKTCSKQVE